MATNGICHIRVKEVKYPLYFGMLAIEELVNRLDRSDSDNHVKILTDMVFSGMCNHAYRQDLEFPKYSEVCDLIEDFFDEEDSSEQYVAIDLCFKESKHGSRWVEKLEELKKKIETMTEIAEKPGLILTT